MTPRDNIKDQIDTLTGRIKAGRVIARHLVDAQEIRRQIMPEIGGKSLASEVRVGLAGLKKRLETLRLDAAAAVNELAVELDNGAEGVKRIRAETAEVKAAFAEILGNEQGATQGPPKT